MHGSTHATGTRPESLRWGTIHAVLSKGSHHPLLCQLETAGRKSELWVVKPVHTTACSESRENEQIIAELAAAEVCSWVGLATPTTGLVRIPDQISDAELPEEHREEIGATLKLNQGMLAFCSQHLDPAIELDPTTVGVVATSKEGLRALALLFAVDSYIIHDDRTIHKPNAMWWNNRVVAIDHGSAFKGLWKNGVPPEDVARRTFRPSVVYKSHISKPHVLDADFADFQGAIAGIVEEKIQSLKGAWPVDENAELARLRTDVIAFLVARKSYIAEFMTATIQAAKDPCA
ncbi:MAG: HipA family kinase [Myxococcaceae bacterium]